MNSATKSNQYSQNIWGKVNEQVVKYWEKMGKLNLWAGVMTAQKLQFENESHQKNREAEEAYVRKQVWGTQDGASPSEAEGDDMGNVYLGDVNHPAPIILPQPPQHNNQLATVTAMAALLGLGTLGGYMLSGGRKQEAPKQDQPAYLDESVSIGLGKWEDFFPDGQ